MNSAFEPVALGTWQIWRGLDNCYDVQVNIGSVLTELQHAKSPAKAGILYGVLLQAIYSEQHHLGLVGCHKWDISLNRHEPLPVGTQCSSWVGTPPLELTTSKSSS